MIVGEVLLTCGAPLGLRLKRFLYGVPPHLLERLHTMQQMAEAEGVIDRDALSIDGTEIVFSLESDDGLVVAAATCYGIRDGELFLQFIYVMPNRRRQGCAGSLWAALVALARQMQAPAISAISKPDNVAMAALYRKVDAPVVGHVHTLNLKERALS